MCAYRLSTSPAITPQLSPATQSGLEEYYKLSKSPQHQQPQLIAASHSYSFSPPTDLSVFALDMDPEEFTGVIIILQRGGGGGLCVNKHS